MTSEELLDKLIKRYYTSEVKPEDLWSVKLISYKPQTEEESKHIIKLRVLNTVKRWLTNHVDNFIGYETKPIVHGMLDFIQSDQEGSPKLIFQRETANVLRLVEQKLTSARNSPSTRELAALRLNVDQFPTDDCPPPSTPLHNNYFDLFKYPAIEFARQLTLIDFFLFFKQIQVSIFYLKEIM